MNKEIKEKWVTALRSSEYKKGRGRLKDTRGQETTYCCLGVLCEIYLKETGNGKWEDTGLGLIRFVTGDSEDSTSGSILTPEVMAWSGIDTAHGTLPNRAPEGLHKLTFVNDSTDERSFDRIAEIIEEYF